MKGKATYTSVQGTVESAGRARKETTGSRDGWSVRDRDRRDGGNSGCARGLRSGRNAGERESRDRGNSRGAGGLRSGRGTREMEDRNGRRAG